MKLNKELVELLHIPTLFDEIDDMMINVTDALVNSDIQLAKKFLNKTRLSIKSTKSFPGYCKNIT